MESELGSLLEDELLSAIKKGDFGLSGWEWIVFLGWAPHPMNTLYQIDYPSGGDACFGANYGGADIYTNIRAGYGAECPNVAKFVTNLRYTLDMENEIMNAILNDNKDPMDAAAEWLKANPEAVKPRLEGVTTFDGKAAAEAVTSALQG